MATYYSDIAGPNARASMYELEGCALRAPFFLTTTALLVNGDLLHLCPILPGSTVTGYQVDCPELDTDGSATAQASLGDATDNALFTAAGTYIRNACRFSSVLDDAAANDNIGCILNVLPKVYTAPNVFLMKITAAVATSAAVGTIIRGYMDYVMFPKYRRPRR